MTQHTPGPWQQGRLLYNERTRQMLPETCVIAEAYERCLVFNNFRESDQGRGRFQIAECLEAEDAAFIVRACNAYGVLLALAERVAAHFDGTDAPLGEAARATIRKATGQEGV